MPNPTETPNTTPTTPPAPGDTFFVLRDCREFFQRRLAEIAQLAGVTSPSVLAAFTREIGEAHDELASTSQQDGFEQTAGLTASRITLVGNDDLELEIRIGDIANHLKGNDRIDHWRAQLRYKTLLHRPKMTMANNPVGFEPISLGLWTLCKESANTLDQNLALLNRLEEQLQLRLPDVYRELNELLGRHGIEPAQVELVQRERGPAARTASSDSAYPPATVAPGNNALAGLQQAMQQQFAGEDSSRPEQGAGQTANFTLNAATLLMLNQLMERLRVFELQQETGLADFSVGAINEELITASKEAPPLRALKSKDLDLPLGKSASIALDTLSLIFESLFTTPDLPSAVKAILGRLQIPLLKLAILDASFFVDAQHPARRLVNRMARAAIGLHQDADRDHPVCVFLAHISDAVRATLEASDGQITPHLAELDTFIQQRDQALQATAQPYVQLVQAHEKLEAAKAGAQDWLDKIRSSPLNPVFEAFLATHWLRAMHDAHLDGGLGGQRWKENETTIRELLWSVEPKTNAEDRKKLLALIPALLKRINAELDRLQVSSEARGPFIDTCFDLQTAALRGSAPPVTSPTVSPQRMAPPSPSPVPGGDVQILEQNGKLVQYFGLPGDLRQTRRSGANPWNDGDWLAFKLPDGEHLCGCCCGQYAPFGTIVLFNPEWAFAVAVAPGALEQQIRDGQARVVSDCAVFDEAAQRALQQMAPN